MGYSGVSVQPHTNHTLQLQVDGGLNVATAGQPTCYIGRSYLYIAPMLGVVFLLLLLNKSYLFNIVTTTF